MIPKARRHRSHSFRRFAKSSDATAIEVNSGRVNSELIFNVPPQPTFPVTGIILVSNNLALPAGCKVVLLSADPLSFPLMYIQDVSPTSSFDFAQVLPGKYWAFVSLDSETASKWLTRKVEVDVETKIPNLTLQLFAK